MFIRLCDSPVIYWLETVEWLEAVVKRGRKAKSRAMRFDANGIWHRDDGLSVYDRVCEQLMERRDDLDAARARLSIARQAERTAFRYPRARIA